MTQLPARTTISDTYPNPSNTVARAGFQQLHEAIDEMFQAVQLSLAAAATTSIGSQLSAKLLITGTGGPVTSLGTTYRGPIHLQIGTGPITFTHNATTLRCPGAVNLVAYAGDILMAWPKGSPIDGWHIARLHRFAAERVAIASHATTAAIWVTAAKEIDWTGTATTTIFPNAPHPGAHRVLHIAAASKITAGANMLVDGYNSGQTVTFAANDIVTVHALTVSQFRITIKKYNGKAVVSAPQRGFISGFGITPPGSSANMVIAAGQATDSTELESITGAASTKTTAAWAVGTAAGGLDTGTIAANTSYHLFVIKRSDTGVVDYLLSLSASSPTMPTNYDFKRRIASWRTDGSSQWYGGWSRGNEFRLNARVQDKGLAVDANTNAITRTMTSVPTGVIMDWYGDYGIRSFNFTCFGLIGTLKETLGVPAEGSEDVEATYNGANSSVGVGTFYVETNTSAQIQTRVQTIASGQNSWMWTKGWRDLRGQDA